MKKITLFSLLMLLFISCEKDYDLIADYCTFNTPDGQTCPLSGSSSHSKHIDIEQMDQASFEVISIKIAKDKNYLAFDIEFSHEIDASSLYYSGTDLDNIIIQDSKSNKIMPMVDINKNFLHIKPLEAIDVSETYTLIIKQSLKNSLGQELDSDKTFSGK